MANKPKRSLSEIEAEIERLKGEAEKIRTVERAEVIARILDAVSHYDITAAELGLAGKRGSRMKAARQVRRAKPAPGVAFADDQGNTWGGRGKRPNWLKTALAQGKTLDELRKK